MAVNVLKAAAHIITTVWLSW